MSLRKLKINSNSISKAYLNIDKIKLIYLNDSVVFADTQTVTINKGIGVASVSYSVTEKDGSSFSGVVTSNSGDVLVGYGAIINFSPSASTGYTLSSYTTNATIKSNASYSFNSTANNYSTTIDIKYSGTEYGNSYGSKIGTFQYSTNNSTWYTSSDTSITISYGSKIYIRSVSPAPGFALSSVTYNGSTQYASSGVYEITVGAVNSSISINMASTTSLSTINFSYSADTTTNSLSRTVWSVIANVNINVSTCSAGAVIGTIPEQYRPSNIKTITTSWIRPNGQSGVQAALESYTSTITINTNGNITTSEACLGTFQYAGYKSSTSVTITQPLEFSLNWSVI